MDWAVALVVIAALVVGAVLGWLAGSRPLGPLGARLAETEEKFRTAVAELGQSRIEVATLTANAENFDKQIALLNSAREQLLAQFKATGGEVLSKAQEEFFRAASERLGHSEKASEEKLKALLAPVDQRLKSYEEQVVSLEKSRTDAFAQLHGVISELSKGQQAVRDEAMRLSSALTNAPKARGRWGEQQLRNLLESCGLSPHTDFLMEHSVDTEDGRLRPDAIVRIPGGKMLVIDSKVSLNAYQEAFAADNDAAREAALAAHVRSMKTHIQALGAKSYQSQFEEAPDYVVMFVPGEHFVAAALESDPDLWNFAFERKVLLATPTNLVAIARTVAQVWRQDALAAEAREIGRIGTEIYDRIATAADHLRKVGGGLESAVNNYNKFVGSFERNVMTSARRLRDKGIEIGKREVEDISLVEAAPRHGASELPAPSEGEGEEAQD